MELPEVTRTQQGRIRKIGFELEFSGVELEKCSELLQRLVDGKLIDKNTFVHTVRSEQFGEFAVEIDADLLKEGKYKKYLAAVGIEFQDSSFEKKLDEVIKDIASSVVPCEIVTPPLPMDKMDIIEDIVVELRKVKAKGTRESVMYAFGLHINPELVSGESDYLLNHIRAFALLYDWISINSDVDLTRKLTPYIDPYPADYLELLFSDGYQPDIDDLIGDYLELVGSRNHALDMLPAFASIDEQCVMNGAKEPHLIKPRPAFHYRLANCLIDKKQWRVADEWWYWLKVEQLAGSQQDLQQMSRDFLSYRPDSLFKSASDWVEHVSRFME